MGNIDWQALKIEYITTDISYRKLAEKHGIRYATVQAKGQKDNWKELRKKHRAKTVSKTLNKISNKQSDKLAKLVTTLENLTEVTLLASEKETQFRTHVLPVREQYAEPVIVEDAEGNQIAISERQWSEEKLLAKYDTKALRDMTACLKDLTAAARDLYELPTQAQAESQRVAAERLKLEQAKANNDSPSEIRVRFSNGGKEKWLE